MIEEPRISVGRRPRRPPAGCAAWGLLKAAAMGAVLGTGVWLLLSLLHPSWWTPWP